jgi:phospholipase D1/2
MNAIQAVQYYNLRSIVLGKFSMYSELKRLGVDDPSEYITFHGMRNWAVVMGELVNEIIYVHSKLMIVDDMHVICGSANINDRSLLGKRDSELAVIITDTEFVNSKFNNTKTQVGKYASSLRQKIFKYVYLDLELSIIYPNGTVRL